MSSSNSETLDQRDNNVSEDSTDMTIEYLRARLLSERSVSRAARLRSEELTKRVVQLEEQLKIVTLQRKRAEKATSEVLSILEDHGISDVSEAIDSSSDEEEICGSNNASDITNEQEGATSIRDGGVNSSSEVESSHLQGRNLSWKSGHRSQNSSQLKHRDSGRRRYASFSPKNSSTNRMGKSCRRNRHQEIRSRVEVSLNSSSVIHDDASTACSEDAPNCSNLQLRTMEEGLSHIKERETSDVQDLGAKLKENQIANSHFLSEDGGYEDMGGAVQHQEQLIGRYEAEENAQREWEEKFKENNTSLDKLVEPANNSDATEEREDVKSSGKPCSASALLDPDKDGADTCSNEVSMPKDLSLAPHVNPSLNEKDSEIAHESSMPDAGTSSSGNSNQLQGENPNHILASEGRSVHSCADDSSSGSRSQSALVPNGATNDVGSILAALQQARFSLKQKLEDRPVLGEGKISERVINPFSSAIQARNRIEIPGIGCPSIFRLPTDIQCEATSIPNSSGSSGFNMADHYRRIDSRNAYFSSPYMEPKSSTLSSGQLHPSSVSSAESISRLHSANTPFEPSADAGLSSSTKFADLDLPFTTYPFKSSRDADQPSSSRFPLDLHGNNSLPFSRTVTHPVNHFSSDIIPRLPFDATNLSSVHKNNDRLHSDFHFPSYDNSKALPPKTRLFISDDRNIGSPCAAHLSVNNQNKRNLHM